MASLTLTFSDLYNRVSKFLGTYGSSGPSGNDLTDAKDIVNDAYRRFIDANSDWSFLFRTTKMVTVSGTATYQLPDDLILIKKEFQHDSDTGYSDLEERPGSEITSWKATNDYSSYPEYFAIEPSAYTKETGQAWEVTFYPTPDSAYTLHYEYKIYPTKLEEDNDLPIGSLEYSDCIRQMCLAEAESGTEESSGIQEGKAAVALAAALANDRKRAPHRLGYNGDGGRLSAWEIARGSYRINDVTYDTD